MTNQPSQSLETYWIQNDVDKLKSVISQIVTYAKRDYPYKDRANETFNCCLENMFTEFLDELQEKQEN